MSEDQRHNENDADDAFSVSSHKCHAAIVAETERYKRYCSEFLAKYGDPSTNDYHRRRVDEVIQKPDTNASGGSTVEGLFQSSVLRTTEYHGNIRLSLLEEQYSDINDSVEMLVTEARQTRQL